jgi:zinc-ribbon domain
MKTEYYYQMPGGTIGGPLALDAIRTAVKVGRLADSTMVSKDRDHPVWVTVDFAEGKTYSPQGYVKPVQATAVGNSNLRPCSACGENIYSGATTCPHCGKTFTSAARIGLIALLTIIILLFLGGGHIIMDLIDKNQKIDAARDQLRSGR